MPLSGPLSGSLVSDFNAPGGGPSSTLNDGLISYYDSDGTDRKGGNHLTGVNGPDIGVGQVSGVCMAFNKASQYYTLPDASAADFQPDKTITMSMWVNVRALASFLGLYAKSTASPHWRMYIDSSGITTTEGRGSSMGAAPSTFANSVWRLVIVSWDADTSTLSRTVNLANLQTTVTAGAAPAAAAFTIGALNGGSSSPFDGRIDQFCLWHRLLAPGEQAELFGAGQGANFLVT